MLVCSIVNNKYKYEFIYLDVIAPYRLPLIVNYIAANLQAVDITNKDKLTSI